MTTNRLGFKDMVQLTSEVCDYHKFECEDILKAFYQVMRDELYKGNSILFEKLFRAEIVKPSPRKIYNPRTKRFYMSPAHPKLKVKATVGLLDYIREMPDTTLTVKKGTASKRLQHHSSDQKGYYID
jgi:nucleoid DNA-binding protein